MSNFTYLDFTGLTEFLTYVKNYVTSMLSSKADSSHTHSEYAPLGEDGLIPDTYLPSSGSSGGGGSFDFDAYTNLTGYNYSYNSADMSETITLASDGTTFATRTTTKGDNSYTIVTTCVSMGIASTKIWTKDTAGNWSVVDGV